MDPYVYPGTNVLRNLRDIRDPARLSKFEVDMTTRHLGELEHKPKPGTLDTPHLQAIHRYIFQDVYPWSGRFRKVDIAQSGQLFFAVAEQVIPALTTVFGELRKDEASGLGE